jgi:phage pi2 protein 07
MTIEQRLIERVEYHQKMERMARVWKNQTVSYHKNKSEAFQEALKILKEVELCHTDI